jgi:hypothetical protein
VVRDGEWTMVANKDTTDQPAPQPVGDAYYGYEDGNEVSTSVTAKQVIYGSRVETTKRGFLNGYRLKVVAGNEYTVFTVENPLTTPISNEINSFTAGTTGWVYFNITPVLLNEGVHFDLGVRVVVPDLSPVEVTKNFNYSTPKNPTTPALGAIIHANDEPSLMQCSNQDSDGGDVSAVWINLAVGDILEGAGGSWSVQHKTNQGTYWDIHVAPASNGSPALGTAFVIQTNAASTISYGIENDYWLTQENVLGFFGQDVGYINVLTDENAYMIDLKIQDASISEDWDVLAVSEGASANDQGGFVPHTLDSHIDTNMLAPVDQSVVTWDAGTQKWIAVKSDAAGLSLVDMPYQWANPVNTSPAAGKVSANSADPALVTMLYFNQLDNDDVDRRLYFESMKDDDWTNLHKSDDVEGIFARYDLDGSPSVSGNIWTVPVTFYDTLGTPFDNNAGLIFTWRSVPTSYSSAELDVIAARVTANEGDINTLEASTSNVDNTADLDKPVSTDTQAALDLKENIITSTLRDATMSKADFMALAEKRIRDNAGSGFSEWGKSSEAHGQHYVNEGIWARSDISNVLPMGRLQSAQIGISRTDNPITTINGVQQLIENTGLTDPAYYNGIIFPPAPDGTKTYDSATGVVTEHATSNEAFEGMVTNGDFRNGTDDWDASANASITESSGTLTITNTGSNGFAYQVVTMGAGIEQTLEIAMGNITVPVTVSSSDGDFSVDAPANLITKLNFTPVDGSFQLRILVAGGAGETAEVHSISVMPATESVITTRQDYGFIESFHESMETNDWFCPLGNTHYGVSDWNGITLVNNFLAQGYSAFGEWDTATKGYGKQWSLMSDAEKLLAVQDPKNTIYYDPEVGEYIQVKYRVRIMEGLGNIWYKGYNGASPIGEKNMCYGDTVGGVPAYPTPQGSLADSKGYGKYDEDGYFCHYQPQIPDGGSTLDGAFLGIDDVEVPSTKCHNGEHHAIPLFLVQRMNQGAYHPEFNPEGTRNWRNVGVANESWYDYLLNPTSTSDAFNNPTVADEVGYHEQTGAMSDGVSGRPTDDTIQYYDAIYADQVHDLRIDANRKTTNELLTEYSRKGIAGTIRGKESVPFTVVEFTEQLGSFNGDNMYVADDSKWAIGDIIQIVHANKTILMDYAVVDSVGSNVVGWDSSLYGTVQRVSGESLYLIQGSMQLTPEYETLPWQDILGDPLAIATTFPNGVYGQWLPKIPDGTNPNIPINRKGLVMSDGQRTLNYGVTWITSNITLDDTLNEITNANAPINSVWLFPYPTTASPYELADNSVVKSELGDVIASNTYHENYGAGLANALLNAVCTTNTTGTTRATVESILTGWYVDPVTGSLSTHAPNAPEHALSDIAQGDVTVKAFPYITSENQQYYLQWVYKEMKWDTGLDNTSEFVAISGADITEKTVGTLYLVNPSVEGRVGAWYCTATTSLDIDNTAWTENSEGELMTNAGVTYFTRWDGNGFGDNNKFTIVNNESTEPDENGNTIIVGQKRVALPNLTGKGE